MTTLETILLAYVILFAVIIVVQTIRLCLAKETIEAQDAHIACIRKATTPMCSSLAQCVKTHHLAEQKQHAA